MSYETFLSKTGIIKPTFWCIVVFSSAEASMHFSFRFFIERSGDWREKYQVRIVSLFFRPCALLFFLVHYFPFSIFPNKRSLNGGEKDSVILINRYICTFISPLSCWPKRIKDCSRPSPVSQSVFTEDHCVYARLPPIRI